MIVFDLCEVPQLALSKMWKSISNYLENSKLFSYPEDSQSLDFKFLTRRCSVVKLQGRGPVFVIKETSTSLQDENI